MSQLIDKEYKYHDSYSKVLIENGVTYNAQLLDKKEEQDQTNFFNIQIMVSKNINELYQYLLYQRWGRQGYRGTDSARSYVTSEEAIYQFEDLIKLHIQVYSELTGGGYRMKKQQPKKKEQPEKMKPKKVPKKSVKREDSQQNKQGNNKTMLTQPDRGFKPTEGQASDYIVYSDQNQVYDKNLKEGTKFYILQVLQNKKTTEAVFFSRFGKVHCDGRSSISTPAKPVEACIQYLEEKYHEKVTKGKYQEVEHKKEIDFFYEKEETNNLENQENYTEENQENQQEEQEIEQIQQRDNNLKPQVDKQLDKRSEYEVYKNKGEYMNKYLEQDTKYFILQILQEKRTQKFQIFTRWGKIGQNGQQKLAVSQSKADAIKEYNKKYTEKTVKGNYREVNIEKDENEDENGDEDEEKQEEEEDDPEYKDIDIPAKLQLKSGYKDNFMEKIAKLETKKTYKNVRQLQFTPDSLLDFNRWQKKFSQQFSEDLQILAIDFTSAYQGEDEEQEDYEIDNRVVLCSFLSNFPNLVSLYLEFTQHPMGGQGLIRLGKKIQSNMTKLEYLSFQCYESGPDRVSINEFAISIASMRSLKAVSLCFWDEGEYPVKMLVRRFKHLKNNFKMDYEQDELEEDNDEFE